MNNNSKMAQYANQQITEYINENINLLKMDDTNKVYIRRIINELKEYFLNNPFNKIVINSTLFTLRDTEYFGLDSDSIYSIHTADNLAFFLYVNDEFKDIFGYKKKFIIGKCIYCLLHEDDFDQISSIHDKVLRGINVSTVYRLLTNFTENGGFKKYKRFSCCMRKIDNIIVTKMQLLGQADKLFFRSQVKNETTITDDL